MSLAELDSKRIYWTYKSGVPIYSSYHAEDKADTYIDVGLDWKLYIHVKSKGLPRLKTSAKALVSSTPMSVNGTTIIGHMTTSVSVLDAKTGALVQIFSPVQMRSFDGKNLVSLGNSVTRFLEPGQSVQESDELVYIIRTDYAFMAYSESRNVLWNFMYSDVTAEFSSGSDISCSKSVFSMQQTVGLENKADYGVPTSCQRNNVRVFRFRDRGHSDHLSLVGSVDYSSYALVGDKEVVPYSVEHPDMQLSVPISGVKEELWASSPFESVPMTAIALPVADLNDGEAYLRQYWWPAFLLLGFFLVLIVGIAMRYFVSIKSKERDKDLKLKPSVPKKKRSKKVAASKNNSQIDKNEGGGLVSAYAEGRQIKENLYISSKEIAKGSNGTVVFEGVYNSRPVAVKRLLKTHYAVAQKESKNLVASDHHPNIVRWYGEADDDNFVYISLERCTCNLNDLVSLYSRPEKSAASQDTDLQSLNGDFVHLQERIGRNTSFSLWRSNGYPSTQILKLMRDVVSGLAHLHRLGFIHRDLKPHNVLIIKENTFCAKLSDMGISKRLIGDMTSLTHATGVGSSGWRAPEQLKNGRQTRAVDLFSLGCVLFFSITGGKHPFGDSYERDSNIVNNRKDLFLVDNIPEAFDLISSLLDPNPDLRTKAASVFHHPLFWSPDTRLSFLRDASDRVELEGRESQSELLNALESVRGDALNGKWDKKLDKSFLDDITSYRKYDFDSVRDLLRVVRNKFNHYGELPTEIQETLGSFPEGLDFYFTSRFPKLLMEVYKVVHQYCEGEELLRKYFKTL